MQCQQKSEWKNRDTPPPKLNRRESLLLILLLKRIARIVRLMGKKNRISYYSTSCSRILDKTDKLR